MKKSFFVASTLLVCGIVFITTRSETNHRPALSAGLSEVSKFSGGKTTQELSSAVSAVLQTPHRSPRSSEIPRLSAVEEQRLTEAYRMIKPPTARFGITAALAFGGGDATAELFRYSLREEFVGQALNFSEEDMLCWIARYLGVLAERSPKARELLLQGCKLEYWSTEPLWKSERNTPRLLANYSMQGVGLLPDGEIILQQFTNGGLSRLESQSLAGAVLTAMSSADGIQRYGRALFFNQIFMQERSFDYYREWAASEKAQPWLRWAEANGFPVLPKNP